MSKGFIIAIVLLTCGCFSLSKHQTAHILKKGEVDISPYFGNLLYIDIINKEVDLSSQSFGINSSFGINGRLNLYLQQGLLFNAQLSKKALPYTSLGIKYPIIDDKFSLFLPISNYWESTYLGLVIEPTLLFSRKRGEKIINFSFASHLTIDKTFTNMYSGSFGILFPLNKKPIELFPELSLGVNPFTSGIYTNLSIATIFKVRKNHESR